jgi:hypothetical protein
MGSTSFSLARSSLRGPLGLLAAIILRLKGVQIYVYDLVEEMALKARVDKKMGSIYINGNQIDIRAIPTVIKT